MTRQLRILSSHGHGMPGDCYSFYFLSKSLTEIIIILQFLLLVVLRVLLLLLSEARRIVVDAIDNRVPRSSI